MKLYYKANEVARMLDVNSTMLTHWESVITRIQPTYRAGIRYYTNKQIDMIRRIKFMREVYGMSVKHINKVLNGRLTGPDDLIAKIEELMKDDHIRG